MFGATPLVFAWPEIGITLVKKFGAGLFGGEGFILERLRGDGMVFLHAGGTIVRKQLAGQTIRIDTGCIVSFTPGISYDIEQAGNLKSMFFDSENVFLATLRGNGVIMLQSLPFARLADRVLQNAPSGCQRKDEGSVLGGLGRMISGDN